jgi:hypothetical protein
MSLSARDRQELSSIEDGIAQSDPRLAGLLNGFSKLMAGQAMPAAERGRAAGRRAVSGLARWRRGVTRRHHACGWDGWLPAVLVLSVVLICTVFVLALTADHAGVSRGCSVLVAAHCASQAPLQR